jgi:sterol desaturase/sphingolipid hydroxylase (fatty acid hydroxylase superfamily)
MVISLTGETLINLLLLCLLLGVCLLGEWTSQKRQQVTLWLGIAGLLLLLATAIFVHDWTRVGILAIGIFLEFLWFRHSNHWVSQEALLTLGMNAFSGMIAIALQTFLFGALLKELPSGTGHWGLGALGTPLMLQIFIYLLLEDFKRYCFHRLDHSSAFFWRFHKIHHGVTELNCITGSRDHPVFNLGHLSSDIGLAYLLGITNEALVIGLSIRMVFGGILPHVNVDFPNTKQKFPWWAYLIATPNFHAWHHTVHCRYDANLADVFPLWDVLFGTFEMPRGSSRDWLFGLNESEQLPQSVVGQLVSPFRIHDAVSPNNSIYNGSG